MKQLCVVCTACRGRHSHYIYRLFAVSLETHLEVCQLPFLPGER